MKLRIVPVMLLMLIASAAAAQTGRAPLEQALQGGLPAQWWRSPALADRLALSSDQQRKMDDIFQQTRLKLIDLTAALDKEELVLQPMVDADPVDAPKIRVQIDRIAQARAELEKVNANMLLALRLILTQDQWKRLQANSSGPSPRRLSGSGAPVGAAPGPKAAPVPKIIK